MRLVRIHPSDNVAVALEPLARGEALFPGGAPRAAQDIPRGHKVALADIAAGDRVVKYGCPIGLATRPIAAGEWVHTHNLGTALQEGGQYAYHPQAPAALPAGEPLFFQGYRRRDGRVGIRNEIWVLPTVGCVNAIAQRLAAENQHLVGGAVEGLYAFPHPYGCSQMGDDLQTTRRLLAALARHPNAGGVLLLGLGCENNTMQGLRQELGDSDAARIQFLVCQEVEDELAAGGKLLAGLAASLAGCARQPIPAGELVVGLKCGGSDGLSGITANPAVGRFSDLLVAQGGTTLLTEVPEMFGAESLLLGRCQNEAVFLKAVEMINGFKRYFVSHRQVVYENPSPGNKAGGITTLEEKSCGCVQKGGAAPVAGVLGYGEAATARGLHLLWGPGNDLVSTTALTAAGAHLLLFTTGRGTPFGAPAPTVKIATNTPLYRAKPHWMDFDAGTVAAGEALEAAGTRLLRLVLQVAGGRRTKAEAAGAREISIFKDGVIL